MKYTKTWRSKTQSTDFNWTKYTYWLDQFVEETGNRIFYLQDGDDRALVQEKLVHVPENTNVPEYLLNR